MNKSMMTVPLLRSGYLHGYVTTIPFPARLNEQVDDDHALMSPIRIWTSLWWPFPFCDPDMVMTTIPKLFAIMIGAITCIVDGACTYPLPDYGACTYPLLVSGACTLPHVCSIWFHVWTWKSIKIITKSQRGSLLHYWVLLRSWCLSYNAVLVPVTVSSVGFRRICLSRHNCKIHSFIHCGLWY
jgi:hypothetical protein